MKIKNCSGDNNNNKNVWGTVCKPMMKIMFETGQLILYYFFLDNFFSIQWLNYSEF